MKTKFALVLSGGGFNGAFQVGALKYIQQNWSKITGLDTPMKFDIISGVSAGAINGALVAMNDFNLLEHLWVNQIGKIGASEIYTSDFIDTQSKDSKLKFKLDVQQIIKKLNLKLDLNIGLFQKIGMIFSERKRKEIINQAISNLQDDLLLKVRNFKSIADNTPLFEKLKTYLNRNKIVDTHFTCGFVSLNTGCYHSVAHKDFVEDKDFVKGVLASTSIPAIWKPVDKVSFLSDNKLLIAHNNVDGGIVNVSPLGDVIKLIEKDTDECEYKIIVINCNSGFAPYEPFSNKSIGAIVARSIYELTLTEIFNNDINHFVQMNELVNQVSAKSKIVLKTALNRPIKGFQAVIINPSIDFDLGSPLVANENLITKRINHGFSQANQSFNL